MKTEINYKSLILYFVCIALYMFFSIMNVQIINQTLIFEEVGAGDLDRIYHYDVIGYSAAGVALLIISTYFSFRQIVISAVIVGLFSTYDLGFTEYEERMTEIYAFIGSAVTLVIGTILFIYVIGDKKITKIYGISIFLLGLLLADFSVDLVLSKIFSNQIPIDSEQIRTLTVLDISSLIGFLLIFIFNKNFIGSTSTRNVNIAVMIKNTDVEMVYFFVIFYIVMVIFYNYESYKLTDALLNIAVSNVKYYIILGMFFIGGFLGRLNNYYKLRLHQLNLLSVAILLFTFLSMPFWSIDGFLAIMGWSILGTAIYITFCLTILILAEKFRGADLRLSIILCSFAAVTGYYCGYLGVYDIEDSSDTAFLNLICLSLLGLLVYYFYVYKKNNLKNW